MAHEDLITLLTAARTQLEQVTQPADVGAFDSTVRVVDARAVEAVRVELRALDAPTLSLGPVETAEEATAQQDAYDAALAEYQERDTDAAAQAADQWQEALAVADPGDAPDFELGSPAAEERAVRAWQDITRRLIALSDL